MPQIHLDAADSAELAEMLTFLADWLTSSHKQIPEESLTTFIGDPAYNTADLHTDLHRFAFLLGTSDDEELFSEPAS